MSKRKKLQPENEMKRQKVSGSVENSDDHVDITKQSTQSGKDKISWNNSDLLQLLRKIEENIPQDDSLSYVTRLDRINWGNITFKHHSVKECQEIWSALLKRIRKFRLLKEIVEDMKYYVKSIKTSIKKAGPTDPNKPKQPWNSYMFFADEVRYNLKHENPDLTAVELSRKMGQLFKDLPMHEKARYEDKAKAARQEYSEKLSNYYSEHPEMIVEKSKKRSRPSETIDDQTPPEKPKTPLQLFIQIELEKSNDDCAKSVFNQRCKDRWNEMNDKDKLFWIKWAEEQYEKYLEDLKEYLKKNPNYEPETVRSILTKKEKSIKAYCAGKPQKPPHSPYHLFTKMMMENVEMQKMNSKDVVNYISEKWKACPEEEKNEYRVRMEQMWEEYDEKLDHYLLTLPTEERSKIEAQERRRKTKARSKPQKKTTKTEGDKIKMKKPEVPPLTDYKYFLSVYKGKENPSVVWNNKTIEEKKVFEQELALKRRKYITLYEQYLKSLSKEELQKLGESMGSQYDTSSECESIASEEGS